MSVYQIDGILFKLFYDFLSFMSMCTIVYRNVVLAVSIVESVERIQFYKPVSCIYKTISSKNLQYRRTLFRQLKN